MWYATVINIDINANWYAILNVYLVALWYETKHFDIDISDMWYATEINTGIIVMWYSTEIKVDMIVMW